jgi:hypothetical protein
VNGVTVQIMQDLNGTPVGLTTHQEPTVKAAQEYAAHWTYEMVKDGFVANGATLTYLIIDNGEVIDIVSYLHADTASVTAE